MIHPSLKRYFETELMFLGPHAISNAKAGIAMWQAGQVIDGHVFIERAVEYAVRAGHCARAIWRERFCETAS